MTTNKGHNMSKQDTKGGYIASKINGGYEVFEGYAVTESGDHYIGTFHTEREAAYEVEREHGEWTRIDAQNAEAGHIGDGQEFANMMKREWAHVAYNAKTCEGTVKTGHGTVRFHESGSDPAVVVTLPAVTVKARPEQVAEAMAKIAEILNNCSL
jgi:hypothetical protein